MRFTLSLVWAATLVNSALGVQVFDSETGFTFSETKVAYTLSASIAFRVAVPSTAVAGQPYDVVFQAIVPNSVGWAGVAWAGTMPNNTLFVGWSSGSTSQASLRWATGHVPPTVYNGATLQKLTAGNRVNGTHFTFTGKCTGCTTYTQRTGSQVVLNPKGGNRLAVVVSNVKPSSPSSPTSNLGMHDSSAIYFSNSFSDGSNSNFADLVRRNGGTTGDGTSTEPPVVSPVVFRG